MYSGLLSAFALVTLVISMVYFYMFARNQQRFMQYWGFSWIAYSISLICLIIYIGSGSTLLLEVRKVVDMFNILFLLFGVYAFMHARIPDYWYRFSLYLILLAAITVIYKFDLLSFYLPISIYQIAIAAVISYNIGRYWEMPALEKYMAILVFVLWGAGKAVLSIWELYSDSSYSLYIAELVFLNILNFCIIAIYAQKNTRDFELAEHLYKKVVDNARDAILYYKIKPFAAFEYATPSIKTLTGYPPETFYRDPKFYLELVTAEYLDEITDVFSGRLQHEGGNIFFMRKYDGENFWGEINSSVFKDKDGDPVAVECILRDITEMKSAQLEQIKAKKSRDLLLSYISHELRTPVTSIAGYLTAINDGVIKEPAEIADAMDTITSKTMLLKKLIDDLDQLSKFETHQFSFDFMTYDTDTLIESLLQEHLPDLRSMDRVPVVEYDADTLRGRLVVADEKRIDQVFSNLLMNAEKYSSPGSEIVITFSIDENDGALVVKVRDRGIGIPSEELPHIFERFFRGRAGSSEKAPVGRGLGLTLSSEIIKAHRGEIYAESDPGQGSTFTFTIPFFQGGYK